MKYEFEHLDAFTLVGFALRTDNSQEGFAKIQQHWGAFFKQGVPARLAMAPDDPIIEAYCKYDSDANGAYTLILGRRMDTPPREVDAGHEVHEVPASRYAKFHTDDQKKIPEVWQHIWQRDDLDRRYLYDFEVIGQQGVDIYVSVNA